MVADARFLFDERLGEGSMGVVYRAHHVRLGHAVAVKVLRARHVANPACRERFLREARLAGQFSHPNLVAVLDAGELDDGRLFMVCELARGETLESIMARGRIEPGRTVALLRQICDGLAAAHALGIVHRDLKPANIMIEPDGCSERVRLLDFGIAATPDREDRLAEEGQVVGTPHYMAPEQVTGEGADARADLYALGVLGFEMIAGVCPFDGAGIDVIRDKLQRVAPLVVERAPVTCDPELDRILHRLLERAPADRWPSATVVGDVLARYQRGTRPAIR